jgi:hypothetical protein
LTHCSHSRRVARHGLGNRLRIAKVILLRDFASRNLSGAERLVARTLLQNGSLSEAA